MGLARYLTLLWPGLPWAWLRGSRSGLLLALAFAVTVDVAVLMTFIWPELASLGFAIALWVAAAAVWLVSTASAVASFPPPIPRARSDHADLLFARARDAYLAHDWLAAETHLRELLDLSPTDGEAQLLWGTLLRRIGRGNEARAALAKLSRSDSGSRWRAAIARELALLDSAGGTDAAALLPLSPGAGVPAEDERGAAAA